MAANQPSPYRPPETPGATPSSKRSILALVALVIAGFVLVGSSIAIMVMGAGQGWFASDSIDDPSEEAVPEPPGHKSGPAGPITLPDRLDVRLVTDVTPGECPADAAAGSASDTVTASDGPTPECLELGDGFFVTELTEVSTSPSSQGTGYVVTVDFPADAAASLADLTEENAGERMVFTYADEIITDATIAGPITGGQLQVTAPMSADEADELAVRIRGD